MARLFTAIDHCVLVHDAKTKNILWANPAACTALGFTLDELMPLKAPDMSSRARPYRREIGLAWLQRAVDEGVSTMEWCYRSKDGHDIWSEARAARVDLARGPVVMVQFRDIAEEKATRRDLSRTEGRLQAFLRNLDEGIVVLDDEGCVLFASESAGNLLDREPQALMAADFAAFLAPDSAAVLQALLATSRRGGRPTDARYRLSVSGAQDTPDRWFAVRCQYIDIQHDLRGLLLLFHDITATVRAEEEHRRDAQYLNYLARYNAMGDMAMAIAHEVSQPISAAHNFVAGVRSRLERDGSVGPQVNWGLESATRQLDRAAQILQSLRAYVVRLEQSQQHVDLNDIVADCTYFIAVRARQHAVSLRWERTDEPLPVHCEKVLIGQVVMNLAFNAIEEMSRWPAEQRSVEVRTSRQGEFAEVCVVDAGKGLSDLHVDRIFDGAFSSKGNGHGIGLALSHRIITRHGGEIEAVDNTPRGATFRFRLPLADISP
ncbi:ATP-binding protein [Streptomyces sp. NBC_00893]|uniref:ATP-binding protein n=1 Tax=Streptomyces sp. NBC_00893 TaxID=2975862 RepID=UPI00224F6DB0|nr:ATP-binding protein [Streptomyces sp. NBC_00893]MCX4850539.1 PAS domain S-box protein [Streptomyces sp. NBC_00893]